MNMKSGLLLNSDQYYLLLKEEEDNSQKFDSILGTLTKRQYKYSLAALISSRWRLPRGNTILQECRSRRNTGRCALTCSALSTSHGKRELQDDRFLPFCPAVNLNNCRLVGLCRLIVSLCHHFSVKQPLLCDLREPRLRALFSLLTKHFYYSLSKKNTPIEHFQHCSNKTLILLSLNFLKILLS